MYHHYRINTNKNYTYSIFVSLLIVFHLGGFKIFHLDGYKQYHNFHGFQNSNRCIKRINTKFDINTSTGQ